MQTAAGRRGAFRSILRAMRAGEVVAGRFVVERVVRTLLLLAHAEALRAAGRDQEVVEAIAAARCFVMASVSGLPEPAREDCLTRVWANVRVLRTAEEWLGA